MVRTEHTLWLLGLLLAAFAVRGLRDRVDRRNATNAFWAVLAFTFLAGDFVPSAVIGVAVLALAALVAVGATSRPASSARPAQSAVPVPAALAAAPAPSDGNALFVPVLLIPLLTVVFVFLLPTLSIHGNPLVAANSVSLVSLALSCAIALVVALALTGASAAASIVEGQRLLDAIGWAAVLPLLLAMLGAVFDKAGVGGSVARIVTMVLPVDLRFVAVFAYAGGMALFTMVMGNAFAAFPVMTAGIGLPILIGVHHADPAPMCALGMLSGYCGTLMTPMAANFNLVPAALLELTDPNGVIKAQAPTGALVFLVNLALMNLLLFR